LENEHSVNKTANAGKTINIAIDGPSGSGKSTLARNIAKALGLIYIDSGSLYRAVGFFMLQNGIPTKNSGKVAGALDLINIEMLLEDGGGRVYLNGKKLGCEIRTDSVSEAASDISKIPAVRAKLLDIQRKTAKEQNCVIDGRDIGSVVLPFADVKIFLSAEHGERAKRRYGDLLSLQNSGEVTLGAVKEHMAKRDENDITREHSPLVPAKDAFLLDNTNLAPEETLGRALKIIEDVTKLKWKNRNITLK